jgi:hypothetical protein
MNMNRTASASSGEVPADCVHMVGVREPLPGVVFGQEPDPGHSEDHVVVEPEPMGSAQSRQLAVN